MPKFSLARLFLLTLVIALALGSLVQQRFALKRIAKLNSRIANLRVDNASFRKANEDYSILLHERMDFSRLQASLLRGLNTGSEYQKSILEKVLVRIPSFDETKETNWERERDGGWQYEVIDVDGSKGKLEVLTMALDRYGNASIAPEDKPVAFPDRIMELGIALFNDSKLIDIVWRSSVSNHFRPVFATKDIQNDGVLDFLIERQRSLVIGNDGHGRYYSDKDLPPLRFAITSNGIEALDSDSDTSNGKTIHSSK